MYSVDLPTNERWIYIHFDKYDCQETDAFIYFVTAYRDMLSGKIIAVSEDMQYKIDNDDLRLMFQWDSCFGITVVVPRSTNITKAYETLCTLCERLNQNL